MKPIILASTSPRRLELFQTLNLPFTAVAPTFEEDNMLPLPLPELVEHLAFGKAESVARLHPDAMVVAADTLVSVDGQVLGKPQDPADVHAMITRLSGRWNIVTTGLVMISGGQTTRDHVETHVHFAALTPAQIDQYARLKEPLDKAGAYGLQPGSAGSLFVDRVEGDYQSAVGLPVHLLARRLAEFGIDPLGYVR